MGDETKNESVQWFYALRRFHGCAIGYDIETGLTFFHLENDDASIISYLKVSTFMPMLWESFAFSYHNIYTLYNKVLALRENPAMTIVLADDLEKEVVSAAIHWLRPIIKRTAPLLS